jgi:hypothetical protein
MAKIIVSNRICGNNLINIKGKKLIGAVLIDDSNTLLQQIKIYPYKKSLTAY